MTTVNSVYATSILGTTMAFLIGTGVPCWLVFDSPALGLGLGGMCALWGGPGFGVMVGSARMSRRGDH